MGYNVHTVDGLYVIVDKETPHIKASEILYEDLEIAKRACRASQMAITLDIHITAIKGAFIKMGQGSLTVTPEYGEKKTYVPIPTGYYVWDLSDNDKLVENLMEGWIAVGITDFIKLLEPVDKFYLYKGEKYERQHTGMIPRGFTDRVCCVQLYRKVQ